MSKIVVKYDPSIELPKIQDLMYATSETEDPDAIPAEYQQTKVTGVMVPMVKVNKILLQWPQIKSFELASEGLLPSLRVTFYDLFGFTKSLDQPGSDNTVQVQVLPPFDNAYKKVNLMFFMTGCSINGNLVTVEAVYMVPALYQDRIVAFGKMTTFGLADTIAKECGLGLASNVDSTNDERYIYCNNKNYISVLNEQMSMSGTAEIIPDIWVDWHNYLIVCDLAERYTATDNGLKVWSLPEVDNSAVTDSEVTPIEVDAIISNALAMTGTQLYIKDYRVKTSNAGNVDNGTDKVVEVYHHSNRESSSTLIQDGDVHKDTIIKTIYAGEVFGGYDYLMQRMCRSAYIQKVKANTIEVALQHPVLGLERGCRVNLRWYDSDGLVKAVKETKDVRSNNPRVEESGSEDASEMSVNEQVSGQYLIIATRLQYKGTSKGWQYRLTLARPQDKVDTYLSTNE